jgi:hypothetical protein
VAVIRHALHGVLLVHSAERRWNFPDGTVAVHESWEQSLRRGVQAATGIDDLDVLGVLHIENFAPGVVHERAQYGVFFLCATAAEAIRLSARDSQWRWVRNPDELAGLELFHPLVETLVGQALAAPMPGEVARSERLKGPSPGGGFFLGGGVPRGAPARYNAAEVDTHHPGGSPP